MSELSACALFGRLLRSTDFERVLRTRSRASSQHFAVHHLAGAPTPLRRRLPKAPPANLSTGMTSATPLPVDDCGDSGVARPPIELSAEVRGQRWLGAVVPKRHARRAVTRSLLKRQIRAAALRHGAALDAGLWVVRLRAPFERADFPSAASLALKYSARAELEAVLARAATPVFARRS